LQKQGKQQEQRVADPMRQHQTPEERAFIFVCLFDAFMLRWQLPLRQRAAGCW
jgi:hypothetical protein